MTPKTVFLIVWDAIQGMVAKNGIEISGYIAFATMLALFPFLIFIVSVAGFFGDTRTGQDFFETMSLFAPLDMMKTLQPALQEVTEKRSGGLLTIGLALAWYSAASGVDALRTALDLSYRVEETRPFWYRKAQNFIVVIFGSIILILASLAIILGPLVWRVVLWFTPLGLDDHSLFHVMRYGFALILITSGVVALHRILPNTELTLRQILPGALTSTVIWIVTASLLTFYFGNFANYSLTYGSLGGVIVTLMFFYISGIIFIFGGELNAVLMARHHDRAPQPTEESSPSALPSP